MDYLVFLSSISLFRSLMYAPRLKYLTNPFLFLPARYIRAKIIINIILVITKHLAFIRVNKTHFSLVAVSFLVSNIVLHDIGSNPSEIT